MTDQLQWPEAADKLLAPFPLTEVFWRVARETHDGRVQILAYLDARAVERRLDEVFTPWGWQTKVEFGSSGAVSVSLGVQLPSGEWIWKSNASDPTDIEAIKGGYSTAFKRAAAHGLGIGRYLYDLGETYVPLKASGAMSHRCKDGSWKYWDPPAGGATWEASDAAETATGPQPEATPAPMPDAVAPLSAIKPLAKAAAIVVCPKCKGPTWDNRDSKRSPRAPDYKCKDKTCDGAVWLSAKPAID